jgi:hypothetical protein
MSENLEINNNDPVSPEELAEVIAEFEQYRERLYNDTMTTAQKAKLSKKATLAKLEPELAKLDAVIENLRAQQVMLTANN